MAPGLDRPESRPGPLVTASLLSLAALACMGQFADPPREAVRSRIGPLVGLPGRVPVPPRLGAVLAGVIESTFGCIEPVAGRVEGFLGPFRRGQSIGERALGRLQPAAQVGQLPYRLPAFPRLVNHMIEDARRFQRWRPRTPETGSPPFSSSGRDGRVTMPISARDDLNAYTS